MKEHNPNCSIKNIPIEFASCTCGITNTMTFKQIEEEYRKEIQRQAKLASIKYGTSIQLQEDFHILLLKQSFIKYLQGEVERHKARIADLKERQPHHTNDVVDYMQGSIETLVDEINNLQAQIKEIDTN